MRYSRRVRGRRKGICPCVANGRTEATYSDVRAMIWIYHVLDKMFRITNMEIGI